MPESDVTIGLRRALGRIETIAQRTLLGQDDEVIEPETDTGAGVDAFVVTSNAAPPMHCVIIGLADDISVASARRACAAANVFVAEIISLGTRLQTLGYRILSPICKRHLPRSSCWWGDWIPAPWRRWRTPPRSWLRCTGTWMPRSGRS